MYDVIIIGGGPAGLSAALTLGRTRRDVLLLDAGQGRNAPAEAVHNFLLNDGTPPKQLRQVGREQLGAYPSVRIADDVVVAAERQGADEYVVELGRGRTERARRLLLATGLTDELPPIDGVAALWGRSAFHCPYCHGFEVSGRPTAVLGAGRGRARLALHLRGITDDVVLCTDGPSDIDEQTSAALRRSGVAIREEPIARLAGTGDQLERVVFADGAVLARAAIFVPTTLHQRSDLAHRLGCAILPDDTVEVDDFGRTSVPGVYAAGDMARRVTMPAPMAAVVVAAASGTIAASLIDQDLLSLDVDLPNPFARPA